LVYHRYIRRNGKVYGPYTYHSRKVDGKVVSDYHGKKIEKKDSNLFIYTTLFIVSLLILFVSPVFTGEVALDVDTEYVIGEKLEGVLRVSLEADEFLPSDTRIIVNNSGSVMDFLLSDFVSLESNVGDFFIEGLELSGSGEGYGILESEGDVDFIFKIIKEKKEKKEKDDGEVIEEGVIEEEVIEEEVVEELVEEGVEEEIVEEEIAEEVIEEEIVDEEIVEDVVEELVLDEEVVEESDTSPITGEVVKNEEINGVVSVDSPFTYNLKKGESIEIVSSSEGVEWSISDDILTVTTDYVASDGLELEIDLASFDFVAQTGTLEISLVYEDIEIVFVSEDISVSGDVFDLIQNESLIEEIVANVTEINTTNAEVIITTVQFGAVVGKPVKWKKRIEASETTNVTIELPLDVVNITVFRIEDKETGRRVKILKEIDIETSGITGNVALKLELEESEGEFGIVRFFRRIFRGLTGQVVTTEVVGNVTEVVISENATIYEVEYETEAPVAIEREISGGKEVVISGPEEIRYENVLAFAELTKEVSSGGVRVYHVVNSSRVLSNFTEFDLNENGLVDYVEWVVPHLSNQTYEIILITKAEHLDVDRNFVEDVFDLVKTRDGNFSLIPAGDYLRVTFEQLLDSSKDITIYARRWSNSTIDGSVVPLDVYEMKARIDEIREELEN